VQPGARGEQRGHRLDQLQQALVRHQEAVAGDELAVLQPEPAAGGVHRRRLGLAYRIDREREQRDVGGKAERLQALHVVERMHEEALGAGERGDDVCGVRREGGRCGCCASR